MIKNRENQVPPVTPLKKEGQEFLVTVRDYRPRDRDAILKLVKELERELAEKFQAVTIKSGLEDYRKRYLNPATKYKTFVAVAGKKIVGYLMGYPSLGAPEVDTMYDILPLPRGAVPPEFYLQITFVSRPFRNRGISKLLHKHVIGYARKQGHKEVYASIAKWNDPELKVIRSFKFEEKDLGYRYRLSLKL
jgi:GNAT superfamily N-acetyltransferase